MSAPSPEMRVLLACARLDLRPEDRAGIGAALGEGLDWPVLLGLARWHGLTPLVHRHLCGEFAAGVPRAAALELWGEAEAIARRNRAMARELARLVRALDARGVRSIPFKGPTLALAVFGDLGLREFGDLDILVRPDELMSAKAAIVEAGYAPEPPLPPHLEAAFIDTRAQNHLALRSGAGAMVELHWKSDPECPVELASVEWWQGAERVALEGVEMRAFGAEDLMLVLCLHGSKHHWASLAWLVDVSELLRRETGLRWEAIARRATQLRCRRRVGVGLALAAKWLGPPLPPLARELASHPGVAGIAARLEHLFVGREPSSEGPFESLRLELAMREGVASGIRLLAASVVQPSLVEWQRWPLPRALFPLYPPLRLGRLAGKYGRRGLEGLARRLKLQT